MLLSSPHTCLGGAKLHFFEKSQLSDDISIPGDDDPSTFEDEPEDLDQEEEYDDDESLERVAVLDAQKLLFKNESPDTQRPCASTAGPVAPLVHHEASSDSARREGVVAVPSRPQIETQQHATEGAAGAWGLHSFQREYSDHRPDASENVKSAVVPDGTAVHLASENDAAFDPPAKRRRCSPERLPRKVDRILCSLDSSSESTSSLDARRSPTNSSSAPVPSAAGPHGDLAFALIGDLAQQPSLLPGIAEDATGSSRSYLAQPVRSSGVCEERVSSNETPGPISVLPNLEPSGRDAQSFALPSHHRSPSAGRPHDGHGEDGQNCFPQKDLSTFAPEDSASLPATPVDPATEEAWDIPSAYNASVNYLFECWLVSLSNDVLSCQLKSLRLDNEQLRSQMLDPADAPSGASPCASSSSSEVAGRLDAAGTTYVSEEQPPASLTVNEGAQLETPGRSAVTVPHASDAAEPASQTVRAAGAACGSRVGAAEAVAEALPAEAAGCPRLAQEATGNEATRLVGASTASDERPVLKPKESGSPSVSASWREEGPEPGVAGEAPASPASGGTAGSESTAPAAVPCSVMPAEGAVRLSGETCSTTSDSSCCTSDLDAGRPPHTVAACVAGPRAVSSPMIQSDSSCLPPPPDSAASLIMKSPPSSSSSSSSLAVAPPQELPCSLLFSHTSSLKRTTEVYHEGLGGLQTDHSSFLESHNESFLLADTIAPSAAAAHHNAVAFPAALHASPRSSPFGSSLAADEAVYGGRAAERYAFSHLDDRFQDPLLSATGCSDMYGAARGEAPETHYLEHPAQDDPHALLFLDSASNDQALAVSSGCTTGGDANQYRGSPKSLLCDYDVHQPLLHDQSQLMGLPSACRPPAVVLSSSPSYLSAPSPNCERVGSVFVPLTPYPHNDHRPLLSSGKPEPFAAQHHLNGADAVLAHGLRDHAQYTAPLYGPVHGCNQYYSQQLAGGNEDADLKREHDYGTWTQLTPNAAPPAYATTGTSGFLPHPPRAGAADAAAFQPYQPAERPPSTDLDYGETRQQRRVGPSCFRRSKTSAQTVCPLTASFTASSAPGSGSLLQLVPPALSPEPLNSVSALAQPHLVVGGSHGYYAAPQQPSAGGFSTPLLMQQQQQQLAPLFPEDYYRQQPCCSAEPSYASSKPVPCTEAPMGPGGAGACCQPSSDTESSLFLPPLPFPTAAKAPSGYAARLLDRGDAVKASPFVVLSHPPRAEAASAELHQAAPALRYAPAAADASSLGLPGGSHLMQSAQLHSNDARMGPSGAGSLPTLAVSSTTPLRTKEHEQPGTAWSGASQNEGFAQGSATVQPFAVQFRNNAHHDAPPAPCCPAVALSVPALDMVPQDAFVPSSSFLYQNIAQGTSDSANRRSPSSPASYNDASSSSLGSHLATSLVAKAPPPTSAGFLPHHADHPLQYHPTLVEPSRAVNVGLPLERTAAETQFVNHRSATAHADLGRSCGADRTAVGSPTNADVERSTSTTTCGCPSEPAGVNELVVLDADDEEDIGTLAGGHRSDQTNRADGRTATAASAAAPQGWADGWDLRHDVTQPSPSISSSTTASPQSSPSSCSTMTERLDAPQGFARGPVPLHSSEYLAYSTHLQKSDAYRDTPTVGGNADRRTTP